MISSNLLQLISIPFSNNSQKMYSNGVYTFLKRLLCNFTYLIFMLIQTNY